MRVRLSRAGLAGSLEDISRERHDRRQHSRQASRDGRRQDGREMVLQDDPVTDHDGDYHEPRVYD